MSTPQAERIHRTGRGTQSPRGEQGVASWPDVAARLRASPGTSWLSVRGRRRGVHTRPVFAAWTGTSFVFATKATAAKTGHLEQDADVSLAVDLGTMHLVAEGGAHRLTTPEDLGRASAAMLEVYDWPTQVAGEELDAPYAAPTSGGPPFQAWELVPRTVLTLPTEDQVEPTRFRFSWEESGSPGVGGDS